MPKAFDDNRGRFIAGDINEPSCGTRVFQQYIGAVNVADKYKVCASLDPTKKYTTDVGYIRVHRPTSIPDNSYRGTLSDSSVMLETTMGSDGYNATCCISHGSLTSVVPSELAKRRSQLRMISMNGVVRKQELRCLHGINREIDHMNHISFRATFGTHPLVTFKNKESA